jgi:hypothetical protein
MLRLCSLPIVLFAADSLRTFFNNSEAPTITCLSTLVSPRLSDVSRMRCFSLETVRLIYERYLEVTQRRKKVRVDMCIN